MSCTYLDYAVAGDIGDVREVVLSGGAPDLADRLDGATIAAKLLDDGTLVATLTGAVVNAAKRIVSISLGAAGGWLATATPGEYQVDIEVTFSDGNVWTFPSDGSLRLQVRTSG